MAGHGDDAGRHARLPYGFMGRAIAAFEKRQPAARAINAASRGLDSAHAAEEGPMGSNTSCRDCDGRVDPNGCYERFGTSRFYFSV